mgnify:CR=1 FL=1
MKRFLFVSSSIDKNLLNESILKKISYYTESKENVLWNKVAAEFPLNVNFPVPSVKVTLATEVFLLPVP